MHGVLNVGIIRVASLQWLVDGYYVEWADGGFRCGCGKPRCRHVRKLVRWLKAKRLIVYTKYVEGQVRPLSHYVEVGGGYLLYSTHGVVEYVEFTPSGPVQKRVRGKPVPIYALRSIAVPA